MTTTWTCSCGNHNTCYTCAKPGCGKTRPVPDAMTERERQAMTLIARWLGTGVHPWGRWSPSNQHDALAVRDLAASMFAPKLPSVVTLWKCGLCNCRHVSEHSPERCMSCGRGVWSADGTVWVLRSGEATPAEPLGEPLTEAEIQGIADLAVGVAKFSTPLALIEWGARAQLQKLRSAPAPVAGAPDMVEALDREIVQPLRTRLGEAQDTIARQNDRLEDHARLFETHAECDAARRVDQDAWGEELSRQRLELERAQEKLERAERQAATIERLTGEIRHLRKALADVRDTANIWLSEQVPSDVDTQYETPATCPVCLHAAHEQGSCDHVDFGKATALGYETFHCYCKAQQPAAPPAEAPTLARLEAVQRWVPDFGAAQTMDKCSVGAYIDRKEAIAAARADLDAAVKKLQGAYETILADLRKRIAALEAELAHAKEEARDQRAEALSSLEIGTGERLRIEELEAELAAAKAERDEKTVRISELEERLGTCEDSRDAYRHDLAEATKRADANGFPLRTLTEVAKLQDGWDSYGGKAPTRQAIESATALLTRIQPVPTSDGGLQLDYGEFSIIITPEGFIRHEEPDANALAARDLARLKTKWRLSVHKHRIGDCVCIDCEEIKRLLAGEPSK